MAKSYLRQAGERLKHAKEALSDLRDKAESGGG